MCDDDWRRRAEQDCAKLVVQYAHSADFGDAEGFGNVFAAEGELVGLDGRVTRPRQTGGRSGEAPPLATLHVCSNILVTVIDRETAVGSSYLSFYRRREVRSGPSSYIGPWLGRYRDRYGRTAEGWRILRREYETLLAPLPSPDGAGSA